MIELQAAVGTQQPAKESRQPSGGTETSTSAPKTDNAFFFAFIGQEMDIDPAKVPTKAMQRTKGCCWPNALWVASRVNPYVGKVFQNCKGKVPADG